MGYASRFERVILRAGAMLIFSVLFQFQRMSSKGHSQAPLPPYIHAQPYTSTLRVSTIITPSSHSPSPSLCSPETCNQQALLRVIQHSRNQIPIGTLLQDNEGVANSFQIQSAWAANGPVWGRSLSIIWESKLLMGKRARIKNGQLILTKSEIDSYYINMQSLKYLWRSLRNISEKPSIHLQPPVSPFKVIQCKANDPCEDKIAFGKIQQVNAHYLAVFDGHGGAKVAEYIEKNIHEAIIDVVRIRSRYSQDNETTIQNSLQEVFQVIEEGLLQVMNREALITGFNFEDCGSCALLAIITNTRIFIANSGDSQGVIIGSRPGASRLTNRQLNTSQPSEVERLKRKFPKDEDLFVQKNKAQYLKGKMLPTYSLGDFAFKYKRPEKSILRPLDLAYIEYKPEIRSFSVGKDDKYLLLASDGLWDLLSMQQVSEVVLNTTVQSCLQELLKRCYQKSAQLHKMSVGQIKACKNKRRFIDDISIVLFNLID